MGILKNMQSCIWEMPECLFDSKAFTGGFQNCLIFQNNLAKGRKTFAEKLCEPQMKLQGVFLPELNPQLDLVHFLVSLKNLAATQGKFWVEQKHLFLLSRLLGWKIHHSLCAVGSVGLPAAAMPWWVIPWDPEASGAG